MDTGSAPHAKLIIARIHESHQALVQLLDLGSQLWLPSFVLLLAVVLGVYTMAIYAILVQGRYDFSAIAVVMLAITVWPFSHIVAINQRHDRLLQECDKRAPALGCEGYTMLLQYFQREPVGFHIGGIFITKSLVLAAFTSAGGALFSSISVAPH